MTNVTTLWKILLHGYDFLIFLLKFSYIRFAFSRFIIQICRLKLLWHIKITEPFSKSQKASSVTCF